MHLVSSEVELVSFCLHGITGVQALHSNQQLHSPLMDLSLPDLHFTSWRPYLADPGPFSALAHLHTYSLGRMVNTQMLGLQCHGGSVPLSSVSDVTVNAQLAAVVAEGSLTSRLFP